MVIHLHYPITESWHIVRSTPINSHVEFCSYWLPGCSTNL